tara:strand:+ start:277 stop:1035 length:759 start_codon:yes stop_codon:yes gene_type:complete
MDKITRKLNNKKAIFMVYTESEASDKGIEYVHWKQVKQGKHGISDDGYVGICLSRKSYTDKKNRTKENVKMCYGVQWVTANSQLLYEPNKSAGIYSAVKPTGWAEKEAGKTRTKNAVNAYVHQLLGNKGIDYNVLGNIYRPDDKIPAATVRRLFKQEEIKAMVDKKLKDILVEKGVTKDMVIDITLEGINIARTKMDANNMFKGADSLAEYLEMKPNKKIITETMEIDVTSTIADQIETEEKKLKLEQKRED